MNNVYRVAMKDEVNGHSFTYAMKYTTSGKSSAEQLARRDYGNDVVITEIRRV